MNAAETPNVDSTRVEELLRGLTRGPRDPDVELFTMLAEIARASSQFVEPYLQRLVQDARSH